MRRRVVPAGLIALFAATLAAWRRRARARAERGELAGDAAAPALAQAPREAEVPATPPDPTAPRFVSVPWTLVSGASEDDTRQQRELPIEFTLLGERMDLDRIDVRETDSQVFVTVLARYEPPAPGAPEPPAYGVAREAVVRLAAPLGERALVHAPDQLAELTDDAGAG
jgi:hypothetical protein